MRGAPIAWPLRPNWAPPRASYRACEGSRDGPVCDVLFSEECAILEGPCEALAASGRYLHRFVRTDGRRALDLSNPAPASRTRRRRQSSSGRFEVCEGPFSIRIAGPMRWHGSVCEQHSGKPLCHDGCTGQAPGAPRAIRQNGFGHCACHPASLILLIQPERNMRAQIAGTPFPGSGFAHGLNKKAKGCLAYTVLNFPSNA